MAILLVYVHDHSMACVIVIIDYSERTQQGLRSVVILYSLSQARPMHETLPRRETPEREAELGPTLFLQILVTFTLCLWSYSSSRLAGVFVDSLPEERGWGSRAQVNAVHIHTLTERQSCHRPCFRRVHSAGWVRGRARFVVWKETELLAMSVPPTSAGEVPPSPGDGAGPAMVTPGDSAVRVYKIVVMGDGSSGKVRHEPELCAGS